MKHIKNYGSGLLFKALTQFVKDFVPVKRKMGRVNKRKIAENFN